MQSMQTNTGWWLSHPSEKCLSVGMIIPNLWKKMFQTTNQNMSDLVKVDQFWSDQPWSNGGHIASTHSGRSFQNHIQGWQKIGDFWFQYLIHTASMIALCVFTFAFNTPSFLMLRFFWKNKIRSEYVENTITGIIPSNPDVLEICLFWSDSLDIGYPKIPGWSFSGTMAIPGYMWDF